MTKARQDNPYERDLDRNPANHTALTPLSFLERAATIYPERTAIIHGDIRRTWAETSTRCRRLASALSARGVGVGSTVAMIAPNIPAAYEAHFGVPMTGAVLNAINIRLDADTIALVLAHGEADVLLTDREFAPVVKQALAQCQRSITVIDIDDPQAGDSGCELGDHLGKLDYEALLAEGDPDYVWQPPQDEWQAIALNYTSGTTGNPKGVVYHHRGAYLNTLGQGLVWDFGSHPVYLWTLPMFHCNGWCFAWALAAFAGTSVCLRRVEPAAVYAALANEGVTHFCGAPVVMNMIVNATEAERRPLPGPVQVMTAGAAPPAAVIERMESAGFRVTHVYGLTECYGPATVCAWHDEWDARPSDERAALKARQGVRYHVLEELMVADPETLEPVAPDGETMGEIFMRGNIVMKGYLKNPKATQEAFAGGWFHTGDLGVMHADGYIEIRDRSKDIIISGGENISTIEVEDVLYRHPAVLEGAVVARPDEHWGETPCAFITVREGAAATAEEIIGFCRERLARFKVPRTVIFGPLPKTATGKIQKFVLRARAKDLDQA